MEPSRLTLRAGTLYRVVVVDRLSAPRILEQDTDVEVRRLALHR